METIYCAVPGVISKKIYSLDGSIGADLKSYSLLKQETDKLDKKISSTYFSWLKKRREKDRENKQKNQDKLKSNMLSTIKTMEGLNKRYPDALNLSNLIVFYRKQLQNLGVQVPAYEEKKGEISLSDEVNKIANEANDILENATRRLDSYRERISRITEFTETVKNTTDWIKKYLFKIELDIEYVDSYIKINSKYINPKDVENFNKEKAKFGPAKENFKSKKDNAKYSQFSLDIYHAKEAILAAGGSEAKPLKNKSKVSGDLGTLIKICKSSSSTEQQMLNAAKNFKRSSEKAKSIVDRIKIDNVKINQTICKEAVSTLRESSNAIRTYQQELSQQVEIMKRSKKPGKNIDLTKIVQTIGQIVLIIGFIAGLAL